MSHHIHLLLKNLKPTQKQPLIYAPITPKQFGPGNGEEAVMEAESRNAEIKNGSNAQGHKQSLIE